MRALFKILLSFLLKRVTFTSSFSTVAMSTSLIRSWDHQDQQNVQLSRGRNAHSPHEDPVALVWVEVCVGEESLASVLSSQSNDVMVEHVEGEALSGVPLEV